MKQKNLTAQITVTTILVAILIGFLGLPQANANLTGSDFQSFNPTADGLDFVTVQSARTLRSGYLTIGGFLDDAFNTLPQALDINKAKFTPHDQLLSSDFHIDLGLLKNWDLGLSLSSVVAASVDTSQLSSYFVSTGMTDIRAHTKFRILGEGNEGVSFNLTANFPQLQNDALYGGSTNPGYDAEIIGEKVFGRVFWGLNGGFRFRSPGSTIANSPYEPVGNEWIASTALAYRFEKSNWSAIGELYSAIPVNGTADYSASTLTALEALAGVKYWAYNRFAAHAGVTSAIMRGTSSPDFRVYAGLDWYPARLWGAEPTPPPRPPEPTSTPRPQATPMPQPTATPQPEPQIAAPVASSAKDLSVFDKKPTVKSERFVVREINFESGSDVVPNSFMPFLTKLNE